jgi:Xaa-Pro aminopeptidase
MWPEPSPPITFAERRLRLDRAMPGPKLFVSGLPRPRNFVHNPYPFRAESHFLYFAGVSLENAALFIDGDRTALYLEPPHPDDALWFGPKPSLETLARDLSIPVRPLDELTPPADTATLPPQDAETAFWLADTLGRDVEAGGGAHVEGSDATLAEAVIDVRLRHDVAAVAQLRLAAAVTAEAHRAGREAARPNTREAAVRAAMEAAIVARGMTVAYASIVTVHGEVLHANTTPNLLHDGDLLLADVGAETPEGWAGDVTRVWPVTGRFSPTQRLLYDAVLAAQLAAIAAVRPGTRYLDVHRAAGRSLTQSLVALGILRGEAEDLYQRGAAALFFPHGIGHLLGLDVHDMEDLGDRAGYAPGRQRTPTPGDRYLRLDRDLEPGMCVTIEPGFYQIAAVLQDRESLGSLADAVVTSELARFADVRGIRIEDDILVTEAGHEILTAAIPKTAEAVERPD